MYLLGGPHRNTAVRFGTEKPKWHGYPMVKKSDDMFNRGGKAVVMRKS